LNAPDLDTDISAVPCKGAHDDEKDGRADLAARD
jgi:hypothetical protein